MKKFLLLIVLLISPNVFADTAYDLYMSGNKAEGIAKWKDESNNGSLSAKYILGMLYSDAAQIGLCQIHDFCIINKKF